MGKKLRELVERLAAEPTAANRDAFRRGLLMSSVWLPARPAPTTAIDMFDIPSFPCRQGTTISTRVGPASAKDQASAASSSPRSCSSFSAK